jgi:hypothetical protein
LDTARNLERRKRMTVNEVLSTTKVNVEAVKNFWRKDRPAEHAARALGVQLSVVQSVYEEMDRWRDRQKGPNPFLVAPLILMMLMSASFVHAQRDRPLQAPPPEGGITISPLTTEVHLGSRKGSKTSGEFTITNQYASMPVVTVVEAKQLSVDADGKPQVATASGCLKLSETSARIGPQSAHVFSWQATCIGAFELLASSTDARKIEGLRLKVSLGTAVYVEQEAPLLHDDISFTWLDSKTLTVENHTDKLARFNDIRMFADHFPLTWTAQTPFPLFPHGRWTLKFEMPPTKVLLKSEKGIWEVIR